MAETDEQIVISLDSIGWAFLIVRNAHRLLDALLDEKPKAEIVRALAVDLDEFISHSISLSHLDDESVFEDIASAFRELRHYTVRVDDKNSTLILKEREVVADT